MPEDHGPDVTTPRAAADGRVLGISAYYHDSAASLVVGGRIIAAAEEERFTRVKHDAGFPAHSAAFCLRAGGLRLRDLDCVVFYDKPLVKFERLLETHLAMAPRGLWTFTEAMPTWIKQKLFLRRTLGDELSRLDGGDRLPPLLFTEHHQAHAASAYYPSPFDRAAVLCLDGVGEWATTSAWRGEGTTLEPLWEQRFPHSLGLLYSAFTAYAGFRVNSGEYKLMGLAPYGEPIYADRIREHLVDVKPDGTFRLDLSYFDFPTGRTMTNARFDRLFGAAARAPDARFTQRDLDVAASIQAVTEEIVLRLVRSLHAETGESALCLAGGVALNCVANGRVLREGPFRDLWIQPAAGDSGGALGAALVAAHERLAAPRSRTRPDGMSGACLGPRFGDGEARRALDALGAVYRPLDDETLFAEVAALLDAQEVVGWFQGSGEFGPRALGGRSILGDPRSPSMQRVMNLRIKQRESFRPFAPAVLAEDADACFELGGASSPYMLLVAQVAPALRLELSSDDAARRGLDRLGLPRSRLPAITHVDGSARVQTVDRGSSPRFHALLSAWKARTGCSVLVNTSFNVRGEPIVLTPADAYRCFMRTGIDALVVEGFLLRKREQPPWREDVAWRPPTD